MTTDPDGRLSDTRFPSTGTVGHAALLLIDRLYATARDEFETAELVERVAELTGEYRRFWSSLADDPAGLLEAIVELLADHRLIEAIDDGRYRVLPAAWRYRADVVVNDEKEQQELFT